jgi:hypothetical protein
MGPDIWLRKEQPDDDQPIAWLHICLSHTQQHPGWPDYTGNTDPNVVPLALSRTLTPAPSLINCHHLVFQNLTLRFGGLETVLMRNCSDLEFGRVDIRLVSPPPCMMWSPGSGAMASAIRRRWQVASGGHTGVLDIWHAMAAVVPRCDPRMVRTTVTPDG